jgi:hypothetical protein
MFRNNHNHDPDGEFSPPPALDRTIRVVVCIAGSSDDIAGRVQRAIGEYSSASDELHVSHAIGPDPRSGQTLYSALIVLRPSGGS